MQGVWKSVASLGLCGGCAAAAWGTHSELVGLLSITFGIPVGLVVIWWGK